MKLRADMAMLARGLAESREKAQALIIAGLVYIGEKRVDKPSVPIGDEDALLVREGDGGWASRGAYKLEKALDVFGLDVTGLAVMDIGAAAGGFTDVLLRRGAGHVYAVDVGYGQMSWKLRSDSRVTVMERTNARVLDPTIFPLRPSLTVMDVSFISIRLILPSAANVMGHEGSFVTLIKPQFEAGRGQVGKHGVIREAETHGQVIRGLRDFASGMGWRMDKLSFSPIKGPRGNIEFLAHLLFGEGPFIQDEQIHETVKEAHRELS